MAIVTVLDAARMLAIEAASVISGVINPSGHLILSKHDGSEIDAGAVLGSVPAASDTVPGIVELATSSEAAAGTDATRATTPASLAPIFSAINTALGSTAGAGHTHPFTDITGQIAASQIANGTITLAMLVTAVQQALNPVGVMDMWPTGSPPTGWLICNGQAVSRTTYAALFGVIGIVYGPGDGSTTFNLPNFKGRVPVGFDSAQTEFNALGKLFGEKTHLLTLAESPSHVHAAGSLATGSSGSHGHTIGAQNVASGSNPWGLPADGGVAGTAGNHANGTYPSGDHTHPITGDTGSAGGGAAHNNIQPSIAVNIIIKY